MCAFKLKRPQLTKGHYCIINLGGDFSSNSHLRILCTRKFSTLPIVHLHSHYINFLIYPWQLLLEWKLYSTMLRNVHATYKIIKGISTCCLGTTWQYPAQTCRCFWHSRINFSIEDLIYIPHFYTKIYIFQIGVQLYPDYITAHIYWTSQTLFTSIS